MAFVATVEIGGRDKLPGMTVGMTIGAAFELNPVQGVFALGNMALFAFQPRVPALQGIVRRCMILHREQGGLPSLNVVAGGTLAAVFALGELAVMGVLVAIRALLEGERLLKIAIGVALSATHLLVFAFQGILRF